MLKNAKNIYTERNLSIDKVTNSAKVKNREYVCSHTWEKILKNVEGDVSYGSSPFKTRLRRAINIECYICRSFSFFIWRVKGRKQTKQN